MIQLTFWGAGGGGVSSRGLVVIPGRKVGRVGRSLCGAGSRVLDTCVFAFCMGKRTIANKPRRHAASNNNIPYISYTRYSTRKHLLLRLNFLKKIEVFRGSLHTIPPCFWFAWDAQ